MDLSELYGQYRVADSDRIKHKKKIIFFVPRKDFDFSLHLKVLGLDRREVTWTYPGKVKGVRYFMPEEARAVDAKLVIQVGKVFSRKYSAYISEDATEMSDGLRERVLDAVGDAFVNLHVHDEFSIRDAMGTVEALTKLIQTRRGDFCCVTNHGHLGGWIRQYSACKQAGLKAIYGCLLPDEPIITRDGVKKICDVTTDDVVLTHAGNWKRVTETYNREFDGIVYNVQGWGISDCWLTGEHPVYVYGGGLSELCDGRGQRYSWDYGFSWERVEDIETRQIMRGGEKPDDCPVNGRWSKYAVIPRIQNGSSVSIDTISILGEDKYVRGNDGFIRRRVKTEHYEPVALPVPNKIVLDEEWARFFGLYISEGSLAAGNGVVFTLHLSNDVNAIEFIRMFANSHLNKEVIFGGYRKDSISAAADFIICSRELSVLVEYLCGKGCYNKKFPVDWISARSSVVNSLLGGIWEGDANKSSNTLRTTSFQLACLTRLAVASLDGRGVKIGVIPEDNGRSEAYDIARHKSEVSYSDCDDRYVYLPIRSIAKKHYSGKVYNFAVEDDNSYVSSVAVHNCEGYVNNFRGNLELENRIAEIEALIPVTLSEKTAIEIPQALKQKELMDAGKSKKEAKELADANRQKRTELQARKRELMDKEKELRAELKAKIEQQRGEHKENRKNNHLLLMAATEEGWYNIIRLMNDANLNGFYYKPRMTHESLKQWGKGIIASSACYAGEVAQFLLEDKWDEARALVEFYRSCFDEFYLELTMVEMVEQLEMNRRLIRLAKETGAKLIMTCDSHYLDWEDYETHRVLLAIRDNKTIDEMDTDEDAVHHPPNMFYRDGIQLRRLWEEGFYTPDGKQHIFKDAIFTEEIFLEAVANTRRIVLQCAEIKLDSKLKLPVLYDDGVTTLKKKVERGFVDRGLDKKGKEYRERLDFELGVICDKGYADYFLTMDKIVKDTIERHGVNAIGWGRGSAAGCLVSYCLGITDLEPIHYGLLFERFLDYSRKDPPDIDTDFQKRIRGDVKERIVEMFGEEHCCSIGSYVTYKTRAVIIDVARALNYDVYRAMEVTKKMDVLADFDVENDEGETEEMKLDNMSFDQICEQYSELKEYFEKHPNVRQHAERLRNQIKNMGQHAGGVIISNLNLHNRLPVIKSKHGVVSVWVEGMSGHELSEIGMVKFDVLGLKHLQVIDDALAYIQKEHSIEMTRRDIPLDDREAIRLGAKNDLMGIFQLEASQVKPVADAVKLDSIFDISALTSLIRPGPKDMGMDMVYARRKHGEPYDIPHFLEPYLGETYGVITYQEQCCTGNMMVRTSVGVLPLLEVVERCENGEDIYAECVNEHGDVVLRKIVQPRRSGTQEVVRLTLDNGLVLECTPDHKVLTVNRGWVKVEDLCGEDNVCTTDDITRVKSIEFVGSRDVFDIGVEQYHNFIANGVVVHNCMQIAKVMCGFTDAEANLLRKAIGKKLEDLMAEMRAKFIEGANPRIKAGDITHDEVVRTYELIESFAGYAFNRAHAMTYSAVSSAELWLKHNYFLEFWTATLNNVDAAKTNRDGKLLIVEYINYARRRRVKVMGPDINRSKANFTIDERRIRFSFGHIRNVATSAELIESAQPFNDMADFYERVERRRVNKRVVESLIFAGAFDSMYDHENIIDRRRQAYTDYLKMLGNNKYEVPGNKDKWWIQQEMEMLKVALSIPTLFERYVKQIKDNKWCPIAEEGNRDKTKVFGRVSAMIPKTSKAGNPMLIVTLTDDMSEIDFYVFEKSRKRFRKEIGGVGCVAAIPLKKFDDGGKRFYDADRDADVIEKAEVVTGEE